MVFAYHQAFKAWLKYALNEWYEGFYDTLQTAPTELGSGDFDERREGKAKVTEHPCTFVSWCRPRLWCTPGWPDSQRVWVAPHPDEELPGALDVGIVPVEQRSACTRIRSLLRAFRAVAVVWMRSGRWPSCPCCSA